MPGIPTPVEHLLPDNESPLLKVLSAAGKRILDIPAPLDLLKRPLDVPAQYLPHLAFEYSVDVWANGWPEDVRRAATEAAIRLQRRKGTAHTLREYVRYAGGEVVGIERPPGTIYYGGSPSKAEREAWLERLPQIRIWQIADQLPEAPFKAFLGSNAADALTVASAFLDAGNYDIPSTASVDSGHRARWVVDGKERDDVRVEIVGTTYLLHLQMAAGLSVYSDHSLCDTGRYFVPTDAASGIITVTPASGLPFRSPVGPSLQAINAEPEWVSIPSSPGRSVFDRTPCDGGYYFSPTQAPFMVYERYPVITGGAPGPQTDAVYYNDTGRYGMPPHTAYVTIAKHLPWPDYQAGEGIPDFPVTKFWLTYDPGPIQDICDAVVASKRLSDRILINTETTPTALADGRPLRADVDDVRAY